MMRANKLFIDTVDLRRLRSGGLCPIMGLLAPHFVEEIELGHHMRRLLATAPLVGRAPRRTRGQDVPSKHVFDVFGSPANASIQAPM